MLKRVAAMLLVLSLALGVVSTGAFTTAGVDRGMDVAVADDDEAYVGYEAATVNATDGEEATLVRVTNRFHSPIDVTDATADVGGSENLTVGSLQRPSDIGVGETGTVAAEIRCSGVVENEAVSVTITTEGGGFLATVFGDTESREVTVSCHP